METLKESKTSLNNNKNEIIVKYRIPISYEEQENNSEEGLKKYSVKILGYNFVENNRYNCEIIYNNKIYELTEYFEIEIDVNCKYTFISEYFFLTIKVKSNINNLSYMFENCKSLIEIVETKNFSPNNLINLSR